MSDWPDEDTPPPFIVDPALTKEQADLALAQHEVVHLRLRLASALARYDELKTQYTKAMRTIAALSSKKEKGTC